MGCSNINVKFYEILLIMNKLIKNIFFVKNLITVFNANKYHHLDIIKFYNGFAPIFWV